MPFGRSRSVPSTIGYSCSNGKEHYMSISSFLLACVRHHSFLICLGKVYIGYSNHLVVMWSTISTTSFSSMIQTQSFSGVSLHTLASLKTSKNGRMDGLLILLELNSTPTT